MSSASTTTRSRLRTRASALACAVAAGAVFVGSDPASAQNIILVIGDDMGVDTLASYGEQPLVAPTPTLDALAAEGVRFRNAWAYPVCSPFRISVLTGRHPSDHGAGWAIGSTPDIDYVLDPTQSNLANILSAAGYRTSAVGKWHMATEEGFQQNNFFDGVLSATESNPNLAGMGYYAGFLFGGVSYFNWPKTVNGVTTFSTTYATTDIANEAIAQLSGSQPFFLWLAFTAPHIPFHEPPHALLADPSIYNFSTYGGQYRAMIEAMDTELGRVLSNVDLNTTTVIFVGDNGTTLEVIEPRLLYNHGKATVYEGGLNVPLIVAGQAVSEFARGKEAPALVQATDLFATILAIAGVTPPPRPDSVSFAPLLQVPLLWNGRYTVFSESFVPNGVPVDPTQHERAVRGDRYKLIRKGVSVVEFYDLISDPYEQRKINLASLTPDQQVAYQQLDQAMRALPEPGQLSMLAAGLLALSAAHRRRMRLAWAGGTCPPRSIACAADCGTTAAHRGPREGRGIAATGAQEPRRCRSGNASVPG